MSSHSLNHVGPLLLQTAAQRWFTPEEIFLILSNEPTQLGLSQTFVPPSIPQHGQLYVYNEQAPFKLDHVQWSKKKGSDRLQETYLTFKIHGKDTIRGVYCKGANNPNFRRRIYRLVKGFSTTYVAVHYRECGEEEKIERPTLHPLVAEHVNKLLQNTSDVGFMEDGSATESVLDVSNAQDISVLEDDMPAFLKDILEFGEPTSDYVGDADKAGSYNTSPAIKEENIPAPAILDYAPFSFSEGTGNAKFLLILDTPIPSYSIWRQDCLLKLYNTHLHHLVAVEWLADNALRCLLPALTVGYWQVHLITTSRVIISASSVTIEVKAVPIPSTVSPTVALGKRLLSDSAAPGGLPFSSATLSRDSVGDPLTTHMLDHDRQYKIRLVEKLGYMKSALEQEEQGIARRPVLHKEHSNEEAVEWLDDIEVSKLSNAELEAMMDKYIISVVKQLVQLGSLDEDLRAEIDAVDSNGLSLLHYCCLYNLTSLIPVLVSRGADIDQVTKSGSSPLHLAVAAGHLLAAQVLLLNGANAHALDGSGRAAIEIARSSGNEEIYYLLGSLSRRVGAVESYSSGHISPAQTELEYSMDSFSFDEGAESEMSSASMTAMLLQETFATLSLTDKCALSLSLGQISHPANQTLPPAPINLTQSGQTSNFSRLSFKTMESDPRDMLQDGVFDFPSASPSLEIPWKLSANTTVEDMSEMQSVLSETDKESLDAAMSMMGHTELQQVEEEVRKIQNNVRGWLLRKNYTNLREATKILQSAWRERKKAVCSSPRGLSSSRFQSPILSQVPLPSIDENSVLSGEVRRPSLNALASNNPTLTPNSVHKSFASLVIQKNLVRWWTHSRARIFQDIEKSSSTPISPLSTPLHHSTHPADEK